MLLFMLRLSTILPSYKFFYNTLQFFVLICTKKVCHFKINDTLYFYYLLIETSSDLALATISNVPASVVVHIYEGDDV